MNALDVVYNDNGILETARYKETCDNVKMVRKVLEWAYYLERQGFRHGGTPKPLLGRVAQSGMYAFFYVDTLTNAQMLVTRDELLGNFKNVH